MPKEILLQGDMFNLEVGWDKWPASLDTRKAVAVKLNIDSELEDNLIPHLLKDFTSEIGRKMKDWARWNILTQEDSPSVGWGSIMIHLIDEVVGDTYKGIQGHLNREECNALIKILRKARDQSFGGSSSQTGLECAPTESGPASRETLMKTIAVLQSECDRLYGKDQ